MSHPRSWITPRSLDIHEIDQREYLWRRKRSLFHASTVAITLRCLHPSAFLDDSEFDQWPPVGDDSVTRLKWLLFFVQSSFSRINRSVLAISKEKSLRASASCAFQRTDHTFEGPTSSFFKFLYRKRFGWSRFHWTVCSFEVWNWKSNSELLFRCCFCFPLKNSQWELCLRYTPAMLYLSFNYLFFR